MSSRPKVLVVDDQEMNVEVLTAILEDSYEVFSTTDPRQATAIAEAEDVDLILLDVSMPEVDGFEVCRRLKKVEKTMLIPVIFVTSLGEVENEAEGFALGAVDYIVKPVRPLLVRARVGAHLELKKRADLLGELALIDSTTELANRRNFDDSIEREWHRAYRASATVSLLMIDVDHFKGINDHYGHACGDACLRLISKVLVENCHRAADLPARYGGDEFALILPDTNCHGAATVANRFLDGVRVLAIPNDEPDVAKHLTVSVGGVTAWPRQGGSPSELVQAADRVLYKVKKGRDRALVEQFGPT